MITNPRVRRLHPDNVPPLPVLDEARLAAGVIKQAIADCVSRSISSEDRADALAFLADRDGALSWWCWVMGVPVEVVQKRIKVALGEPGTGGWEVGMGRLLRSA